MCVLNEVYISGRPWPTTINARILHLGYLAVVRPTGVYRLDFLCSGMQFYLLWSPYLCSISFLYLDLYIPGDDASISYGSFMQTNIYVS